MILLPVDLLPRCNCPMAGGETIMKLPFIGLTVKVKRPLPRCRTLPFCIGMYVFVREKYKRDRKREIKKRTTSSFIHL